MSYVPGLEIARIHPYTDQGMGVCHLSQILWGKNVVFVSFLGSGKLPPYPLRNFFRGGGAGLGTSKIFFCCRNLLIDPWYLPPPSPKSKILPILDCLRV